MRIPVVYKGITFYVSFTYVPEVPPAFEDGVLVDNDACPEYLADLAIRIKGENLVELLSDDAVAEIEKITLEYLHKNILNER